MLKWFYIFLFLTFSFFIKAQKDTSLSHHSNINNLIGIDGGYTNRYYLVGNKGDIGFNYMYNHKHLLAKSKISFTPGSNFGLLTKIFINAGFTTKIDKIVSWNLLGGFGLTTAQKTYDYRDNAFHTRYGYGSLTPIIESGLLFRPFKSDHFLFGLNGSSYIEKIRDLDAKNPFFNFTIYVISLTATILYKF